MARVIPQKFDMEAALKVTARQKALTTSLVAVAAGLGGAAWWSFRTVNPGSLGAGPVNALIVFGSPAEMSGDPSPMQTWRVSEAAREFRRGMAPHVIFTGGPTANSFVEADVMAKEAERLGVPANAILTERSSRTTIENLTNVSRIMRDHGWSSAEFISSPDHLPRIAVLARSTPFQWRLHDAPTPGRSRISTALSFAEEGAAILLLRTFGSAAEPVIHVVAICVHWVTFLPRWVAWKLRQHTHA